MKKILVLLLLITPFCFADDPVKKEQTAAQKAEKERCKVPAFAKAIGHEELWKKHNGCPTSKTSKDE